MTKSKLHPIGRLSAWLDMLQVLQKPDVITLVGAGNGSGELTQWVLGQDQSVARLIEAGKGAFEQLRRVLPEGKNWRVQQRLILPKGTCAAVWHQYDLPSENSLVDPQTLKAFWPGIQETDAQMTEGFTLTELLNESAVSNQWLLVDCMPAARLLEDTNLESVSLILARTAKTKKQTQAQNLDQPRDKLEARGFELIAVFEERNTALTKTLFARSSQQQTNQTLREQLEAARTAQTKQAAKYEQKIKALQIELETSKVSQAEQAKLDRLERGIGRTLKKEVANAVKQVGDFICLQNYFQTGGFPDIQVEINGWPVSSDFMLYLVKLIDRNDYDIIIEFGSGSSTFAIAKTLHNMALRRQDKAPADFVSFEHLEHFYQQTLAQIAHAGLADVVQLHLTPLADYAAPNGSHYPYYACQPVLAGLANMHPNKPLRLLVVIDGPPESTGKHARYPAGPLTLEYFEAASIDLLLDDAGRVDEKEIVALWETDIAAAGLRVTHQFIKLEKGASLIQIESNAT